MSTLRWGVGDIIAVSKLAAGVYAAYKDAPDSAPDDYKLISEEVMILQAIINTAIQHFGSTALSHGDSNQQEGQEILMGCQSVLEDLNYLEKYNPTNTSQTVKLGAESITTLRVRLISNTGLLNGFVQRFDIPTITTEYGVYYANTCTSAVNCVG